MVCCGTEEIRDVGVDATVSNMLGGGQRTLHERGMGPTLRQRGGKRHRKPQFSMTDASGFSQMGSGMDELHCAPTSSVCVSPSTLWSSQAFKPCQTDSNFGRGGSQDVQETEHRLAFDV